MSINMDTVRAALGADFDPKGDYLVCGYDQLHTMESKGYRQVGKVQDPSPGDRWLLVFDRRKESRPGMVERLKKSLS